MQTGGGWDNQWTLNVIRLQLFGYDFDKKNKYRSTSMTEPNVSKLEKLCSYYCTKLTVLH